ncbi:MAG: tryptophan 7-halogenase [Sphingomonas sp.]|nr:tryptophan 7-halogenase [Sphingomonas sp.]
MRDVVVLGGGLLGWSAAAALRRKLPALRVTVIPLPPPPDALAERIGSTLPSIVAFHRDIGMSDGDALLRANCSVRLGTEFQHWNAGLPSYVHAYDRYGQPLGTASFHIHWARQARLGSTPPFDQYSPAAAMARSGRFVLPETDPASPFAHFEYGLALNPVAYPRMMRAYAQHLGAIEHPGGFKGVRLDGETGFIAALALDDGQEIKADLFVDCSGPRALLRGALDQDFEDWSRWLPCDRLLLADAAPVAEPSPLDRAIAHGAGWRWVAQSISRTSHGFAYASSELSDDKAARTLRGHAGIDPQPPIALRQGRRPQPWLRNCVALGDAATMVEPLEWTNLHLAHSAIDRLVAMMPDRDCAAVELWDYNRQCAAETDRVRDFLALHYATSQRDESLWRRMRDTTPPASLAHTMRLFAERGRLPFYEDETFARDSWLAVLLGQGLIPRRIDPLIDAVPPAQSEQGMAAMREGIARLVPSLPTHADFLRNLQRQAAR